MTASPSSSLAVGDRVVRTVEDMFVRPDWGQRTAYVVMFEHDDPSLPPGGEFTGDRLAPAT